MLWWNTISDPVITPFSTAQDKGLYAQEEIDSTSVKLSMSLPDTDVSDPLYSIYLKRTVAICSLVRAIPGAKEDVDTPFTI